MYTNKFKNVTVKCHRLTLLTENSCVTRDGLCISGLESRDVLYNICCLFEIFDTSRSCLGHYFNKYHV